MGGLTTWNEPPRRNGTLIHQPGITRTIWVDSEIPPNTPPGTYTGAIRIQANRVRFVEIPLRIDVLPFPLPGPGHGHGTSIPGTGEFDLNILRHVNALSIFFDGTKPDSVIREVEKRIENVVQVGPRVETLFLGPGNRFAPETATEWVKMLTLLRQTAEAREWPRMVLRATDFEEAGFPREAMKKLCKPGQWVCASVSNRVRPRKRGGKEEVKWLNTGALKDALRVNQPESRRRILNDSWLVDAGCGRLGKGFSPGP